VSERRKERVPNARDLGAPERDAFLRDLAELPKASAQDLEQLAAALEQTAPADELRQRLLAELPSTSRFERFADTVAELLDIERSRALRLLDQLDNRAAYNELMPGIELLWVPGGPRVADAVRGFVRVAAGLTFPEHQHFGEERVLVLQGSFVDPSRDLTFRPGDIDSMQAGTSHLHLVPADGTDLLMLSVVQMGVSVSGQTYLPNQVPTTQH
jgi:hypothetical protein